jgi:hypothetical protein
VTSGRDRTFGAACRVWCRSIVVVTAAAAAARAVLWTKRRRDTSGVVDCSLHASVSLWGQPVGRRRHNLAHSLSQCTRRGSKAAAAATRETTRLFQNLLSMEECLALYHRHRDTSDGAPLSRHDGALCGQIVVSQGRQEWSLLVTCGSGVSVTSLVWAMDECG